jgi:hypothetical protein
MVENTITQVAPTFAHYGIIGVMLLVCITILISVGKYILDQHTRTLTQYDSRLSNYERKYEEYNRDFRTHLTTESKSIIETLNTCRISLDNNTEALKDIKRTIRQ